MQLPRIPDVTKAIAIRQIGADNIGGTRVMDVHHENHRRLPYTGIDQFVPGLDEIAAVVSNTVARLEGLTRS
jgi:hypothetical protein